MSASVTRSLPLVTADLPGIGGEIKAEPAHFIVEEVPLYEPCGEGEHVYVRVTREGWTTRALHKRLARLFGLREVDVGYAGLKDKHARTTQTFSLLIHNMDEATTGHRIQENLPVEVLWVRRHRNKLKRGHLLGNHFNIIVLGPEPDALARAERIAQRLHIQGFPNFYGAQRFGVTGENALKGREVLLGQRRENRWTQTFLLSAYQAELFNTWLVERTQWGWFDRLLTGDIAKKLDTGGLFEVENATLEAPRFQQREITYTGPIYGWRMRWANGEPGALERQVLENDGVTTELLRQARLSGSRRPARLFVEDLCITPHPDGLHFEFTLPKAAYATNVLREFMKTETELPDVD
jgi:tRNA pseudouridine13 synthase